MKHPIDSVIANAHCMLFRKIKCSELCDYIQSYSNSSRMKKHRLLCDAYLSSVNIEYCQESKENNQELFF